MIVSMVSIDSIYGSSYLPDEKSRGTSSAGPRVRFTYASLETEQSSTLRQFTANSKEVKPSKIYDIANHCLVQYLITPILMRSIDYSSDTGPPPIYQFYEIIIHIVCPHYIVLLARPLWLARPRI